MRLNRWSEARRRHSRLDHVIERSGPLVEQRTAVLQTLPRYEAMFNTRTHSKNPPTVSTREWKAISVDGHTEYVHRSGFRTTSADLVDELRRCDHSSPECPHTVHQLHTVHTADTAHQSDTVDTAEASAGVECSKVSADVPREELHA